MPIFTLEAGQGPLELMESLGELFPVAVQRSWKETLAYRDTFDWRLHRAGLTLTSAEGRGGVRIQVLGADNGILEARGVKPPHFADGLPEGPVRELILGLAGPRRLLSRARVEWQGTLYGVLNADEKTVTRLLLREGRILDPDSGEEHSRLTRLQCLALKGYGREADRVKAALGTQFGLRENDLSEADFVFALAGLVPGDYSSGFSLELDPTMPAGAAARLIHLQLLEALEANQEGMVRNLDPEFLHDFRVSVRRTRSALTQIKGVLPPEVVSHFKREFRWLGSRTGPARDMDVYLMTIPRHRAALQPSARKDLEPLVQLLKKKKRAEYRRLRGCIRSGRYQRLLEDWRAFLEASRSPDSDPPGSDVPILDLASSRIRVALAKVVERGNAMENEASPEALHGLRIDCKKLRYLVTFFSSLYPEKTLSLFTRELKLLQQHLGDFNDLQVQRTALEEMAKEMMDQGTGPPATLLAMGQLMGQLEGAQIRERGAFHEHFARFSRPKNQERLRKLFSFDPENIPEDLLPASTDPMPNPDEDSAKEGN